MIRTSSMVNLLNDDDWKLTFTEPGLPKKKSQFQAAPENFYSQSAIAPNSTKLFYFTHFNKWRRLWEYILLIVSAFPFFEISFISIFCPHVSMLRFSPLFIFDIIFGIDIFISSRTAYLSQGVSVTDPDRIFRRYGKVWFVFQIIATIPLNWIGVLKGNRYLYLALSINKVIRLRRAFTAAEYLLKFLMYHNWKSIMFPFCLLLLCFAHFFACLFYICAVFEDTMESWIGMSGWDYLSPPQLYVVSVYFVMTTILTIGYGDLTPKTSPETILVIFIQLLGVLVNAYILSIMVSILIDPIGNEFIQRFISLSDYMHFKHVPPNVRTDIKQFLQMKWQTNHGTEDPENVYKFIPETVRDNIKRDICRKCFSKVSILRMASESLLTEMANLLRDISFSPGEVIVKQNVMTHDMILLNNGIIDIYADGSLVASSACDDGLVLGEQELFVDTPRAATVIAVTYVEGWIITRDFLIQCLAHRHELKKDLLDSALVCFPAKYKEIRKLLSGENIRATVERNKAKQREMIQRILRNHRDQNNTDDDSSSDSNHLGI
ncbi:cation channel family protein [Trichomonas vaginalis G3]|uniref:Cation channel family protein n=1 Tax=Trichomonas vaginalis (strain ATCC PRA-98 / G3) TaxID=412133 RepID=A2ENC9_TRIV3|nr:phosphorelay sensor kinase protein [Trichomonas vaginalis G3]EAY05799.1 cation channel family protein [Trichomonas vaginalis G3]KAI5516338.1 phosphorelay sensor kinase protein [Trichomonas vaginalis G3]|eukprot:XP_001318022.1 cation channel family protein [Trichomonas vaginalis G3]